MAEWSNAPGCKPGALVATQVRILPGAPVFLLSGILKIFSLAWSAKRYGNTGSPRTARLAKQRFEPSFFVVLLCKKVAILCDFDEG